MSDIYDGAFRTIVNDCRQFVLPFINEVFGEHYDGTEEITFHPNEHFIDQQDEPDLRRITDTNVSSKHNTNTGQDACTDRSSRVTVPTRVLHYVARLRASKFSASKSSPFAAGEL